MLEEVFHTGFGPVFVGVSAGFQKFRDFGVFKVASIRTPEDFMGSFGGF